ncbi:hypothetical protein [Luteolibacter sp. Populi]|uniref:hypothetical protein n=1 Tax=Luteolibacter sp. Populi TaxID=3230487 RepID=UPI003467E0D2
MNELTQQLLVTLWDRQPGFGEIDGRLAEECKTMSAAEAGVIGRDLILRRQGLYTKLFSMAAYLASGGTAGNDSFMDFADCVAILPEDRYQRIVGDPDALIDDEVSEPFGEFYFVSRVTKVFDRSLLDEDGGFLRYLVLGPEDDSRSKIYPWEDGDEALLPRLHAKYGQLLRSTKPHASLSDLNRERVTLDDLIP